jgi:transcriptional regulator with XRE-family HTH domain
MTKTRFSYRLQNLRERKGYTQAELAKVLGCSQQTVSSWESGDLIPSYEYVLKIVEFYKISIAELSPVNNVSESEQSYRTKKDLFETFFTSNYFLDFYPKLTLKQALKLSKLTQAYIDFLEDAITIDEQ